MLDPNQSQDMYADRTSKKLGLQVHGIERVDGLVHSWTRFVLQDILSASVSSMLSPHGSRGGVFVAKLEMMLTFWDLFETLISGSHDCGFFVKI